MPNYSVKTHASTNTYLYFKHNDYASDISGWQGWLADQYDAGTPVTAICKRLNPTIAPRKEPVALTTYDGTKTVSSTYANASASITYRTE